MVKTHVCDAVSCSGTIGGESHVDIYDPYPNMSPQGSNPFESSAENLEKSKEIESEENLALRISGAQLK